MQTLAIELVMPDDMDANQVIDNIKGIMTYAPKPVIVSKYTVFESSPAEEAKYKETVE